MPGGRFCFLSCYLGGGVVAGVFFPGNEGLFLFVMRGHREDVPTFPRWRSRGDALVAIFFRCFSPHEKHFVGGFVSML